MRFLTLLTFFSIVSAGMLAQAIQNVSLEADAETRMKNGRTLIWSPVISGNSEQLGRSLWPDEAEQICRSLGGRLPTFAEVVEVMQSSLEDVPDFKPSRRNTTLPYVDSAVNFIDSLFSATPRLFNINKSIFARDPRRFWTSTKVGHAKDANALFKVNVGLYNGTLLVCGKSFRGYSDSIYGYAPNSKNSPLAMGRDDWNLYTHIRCVKEI
jgi:hypothetical protein